MISDESSKTSYIEVSINVLSQALSYLHEHDYASAQVMVAVARQMLEDVQLEFDSHFQVEEMLKQLLNSTFK